MSDGFWQKLPACHVTCHVTGHVTCHVTGHHRLEMTWRDVLTDVLARGRSYLMDYVCVVYFLAHSKASLVQKSQQIANKFRTEILFYVKEIMPTELAMKPDFLLTEL